MTTTKPTTIGQYIDGFPAETQALLEQVRQLIRKEVPEAEETISYGIPTFELKVTYLFTLQDTKSTSAYTLLPLPMRLLKKTFPIQNRQRHSAISPQPTPSRVFDH